MMVTRSTHEVEVVVILSPPNTPFVFLRYFALLYSAANNTTAGMTPKLDRK